MQVDFLPAEPQGKPWYKYLPNIHESLQNMTIYYIYGHIYVVYTNTNEEDRQLFYKIIRISKCKQRARHDWETELNWNVNKANLAQE